MSDVRQAAERLRGGFSYEECPDGWQECNDARLLAKAYLAEHPADDGVEIDEAWLRSVGFARDGREFGVFYEHDELNASQIVMRSADDWRIGSGSHRHQNLINWCNAPKTRGDVRRLASALGIKLGQ